MIPTSTLFGIGIGFDTSVETSLHWHASKDVNEDGELHAKYKDGVIQTMKAVFLNIVIDYHEQ